MDPFTGAATFLSIWWVVLFVTLPIGVRSQLEDGEVVEGSERGAPSFPNLKKKALWTTGIAFVVWGLLWTVILTGLIRFDRMPFFPG